MLACWQKPGLRQTPDSLCKFSLRVGSEACLSGGHAVNELQPEACCAASCIEVVVNQRPKPSGQRAGDATLSVSCSDKLARWALLGCQGALLGELLCAPLHLAGLAVCAPAGAACALRRAVEGERWACTELVLCVTCAGGGGGACRSGTASLICKAQQGARGPADA